MGDQVGQVVEGTLYYIPYAELERIRGLEIPPTRKAALFADLCRLNALYMIARAGSGHIGSSFSSLDIVSWLLLTELHPDAGDVYFSSKGHDVPGYYSALIGLGRLEFELIHQLRRLNGLPGHPDIGTPGVATNTGSLAMGVSKAKGMIFANRLRGVEARVYVLTGDGELQEGQFWESLVSAANHGLHELTVVVDHNKLQSDTFVARVSDLGDLAAKLSSFGWHVERCSGHDLKAFAAVLAKLEAVRDRPKVVIADTIKGRGVSFMEHTALDSDVTMYQFHSGAPDAGTYVRAVKELGAGIDRRLVAVGAEPLRMATVDAPRPPAAAASPQRLVRAYANALIDQAQRNPNLVALDADLVLDTGLVPFRERFPERFVECGIAEQDMVSQAGGMALRGLLPIVHSFACFLAARPNEQIYNNSSEHTRVIYVGSLAGVLPGGPGHSHQAVRDISALAAIPGLVMLEPSCEREVPMLLDYCVNRAKGSSYLRLVSVPYEVPFELPADYTVAEGKGVPLTEGSDAVVFAYGPVLLSEAYRAAVELEKKHRLGVKVVNLPWLNTIDRAWLLDTVVSYQCTFSLENHYVVGGQGDRLCSALAEIGYIGRLERFGITDIPVCGSNQEVLASYGLDWKSLAERIAQRLLAGRQRAVDAMSSN